MPETASPEPLLTKKLPKYEMPELHSAYMFHGRLPPFSVFRHVPMMEKEPRIQLAMEYIKGTITSRAMFYVDETGSERGPEDEHRFGVEDGEQPASKMKKFIMEQLQRWWTTSARSQMMALDYGFFGAEVNYCIRNNMTSFHSMTRIAPMDCSPVSLDGDLVGMVVKNHTGVGRVYIGGPKKLWHVQRREQNKFWGRSRYAAAYDPWMDLVHEGGAKDIKRLYFHKNVYQGDTIYFPADGITLLPDGTTEPAAKTAQRLVTQKRTGAAISLPSLFDESGNRLWEIVNHETGSAGQQLLDNIDKLKDEMTEGIGVPRELIEAAETGSGYSGRKVPQDAFHGMLAEILFWMVHDFDEQVIKPLVRMNFGITEPNYQIIPFGLVEEPSEPDEPQPPKSNKQAAQQAAA